MMALAIPDLVRCTCADCGPRRKLFIQARYQLILDLDEIIPHALENRMPLRTKDAAGSKRYHLYTAEFGFAGPIDRTRMLYIEDDPGTSPRCVASVSGADAIRQCLASMGTFRQALDELTDIAAISPACVAFTEAIMELGPLWLHASAAETFLGALAVLRESLIGFEEPELYNDMIRDIKSRISLGKLGVGLRVVWSRVQEQGLGLVVYGGAPGESEVSKTTVAEAALFLYDLNFTGYNDHRHALHTLHNRSPTPIKFFSADVDRVCFIADEDADQATEVALRLGKCADMMATASNGKRERRALACATEALTVMRSMLARKPDLYNDYIRGFKERLFDDGLFTFDEADAWCSVRLGGLGLVVGTSTVTEDEARRFLEEPPDD